jgi:dGTPase
MEWDKLLSTKHDGEYFIEPKEGEQYSRSQFEREYHYIISCPAFRRLQDKTQVFPLDTSDFVRTRLTHSLETSSLAKTLGEMVCHYMLNAEGSGNAQRFVDIRAYGEKYSVAHNISNILMCAGLLHDIGNPPFGHFGETIMQDWFKENLPKIFFADKNIEDFWGADSRMLKDLYNFEGNAQALRLLTKLHFQNDTNGLHLTYALLNTIIKYPTDSLSVKGKNAEHIAQKKIGYFLAEDDIYARISEETGAQGVRHPLAYLLEAADDIAYATADMEDAFKKGMFTFEQLIDTFKTYDYGSSPNPQNVNMTKKLLDILVDLRNEALQNSIDNPEMYAIRNWIPSVQFWFLYCASYSFTRKYNKIMNGTYACDLFKETNHEYSRDIFQKLMGKYVYPTESIEKLEIAAHTIITGLLNKFINAVLYFDTEFDKDKHPIWQMTGVDKKLIRLISDNYIDTYKRESEGKSEKEKLYLRLLLITDYICGMSDSFAKSLYQRLEGIY